MFNPTQFIKVNYYQNYKTKIMMCNKLSSARGNPTVPPQCHKQFKTKVTMETYYLYISRLFVSNLSASSSENTA